MISCLLFMHPLISKRNSSRCQQTWKFPPVEKTFSKYTGLWPTKNELQWISLISFDDTWSTFAFRLKTETDKRKESKPRGRPIFQYIDPKKKVVRLPEDFKKALSKNKKQNEFYLLHLLALHVMNLTNDIYQRIVAAKVYIDDNYREQIDLREISEQAFLSPFHFHRLFTKVYNNGSFSVLFKKKIGFAPQYYRNIAWLKKQKTRYHPKAFIPHCFIDSFKLENVWCLRFVVQTLQHFNISNFQHFNHSSFHPSQQSKIQEDFFLPCIYLYQNIQSWSLNSPTPHFS